MGLDMFLNRRTYVRKLTAPLEYESLGNEKSPKGPPIQPERVKYVIEEVGYWRKANAIHQWFVDNAGGGIDECQEMQLDKEQLGNLYAACEEVRNARLQSPGHAVQVASTELPTTSGFFFGSTEYDEWYYQDIDETMKILKPILDGWDSDIWSEYIYQASW